MSTLMEKSHMGKKMDPRLVELLEAHKPPEGWTPSPVTEETVAESRPSVSEPVVPAPSLLTEAQEKKKAKRDWIAHYKSVTNCTWREAARVYNNGMSRGREVKPD